MATVLELKARELEIRKEELELAKGRLTHDKRKTIWLSAPLTLAVIGGIIAFGADYVMEGVKSRNSRDIENLKAGQVQEAHMLEAALDLVKQAAAPGSDVEHTRRFLRFVIDVDIGPLALRQKLEAYLNKPDAQLPPAPPATGGAASQQSSTPPRQSSSNQPASKGETGWFYLGQTDDRIQKWVGSSALGTFEFLPQDGSNGCPADMAADTKGQPVSANEPVPKLQGRIVRTLGPKYLRGPGVSGQRVRSPVQRTMDPGTILRLTALDFKGPDGSLPVLWAEVEVCWPPRPSNAN